MEPLSLEEAKSHLRVDFPEDDAYITSLITVARDYAEGFQKRSIVQTTLELVQDMWTNPIILERGPVKSVTSLKYIKSDGTEVIVPATDYIVTVDGKIVPKSYWPIENLQIVDGIRVIYEAVSDPVPESTKQAMLLLIGNWYEHREPVVIGRSVEDVPFTVKSLLWMGM